MMMKLKAEGRRQKVEGGTKIMVRISTFCLLPSAFSFSQDRGGQP